MSVFYVDNYLMPISHHQAGLVSGELLFLSWVPGDDFNGSGCSSLDDGVGVGESGVEQRHMLQQLCPGPRNLCQDCKGTEGIGTHRCILTRAVVKSTFVESKTSPSPKRFESESSPSPKRFESESSPSPKRFESKSKSKSKWDGQNRERKKSSSKPHT